MPDFKGILARRPEKFGVKDAKKENFNK